MKFLLILACVITTTFVMIFGGWYTSVSNKELEGRLCADSLRLREYFKAGSCKNLNRITLGDIDYYSMADLLMDKSNDEHVVLDMFVDMSFSQESFVGIKQVGPEKFVAFKEKANASIWNTIFIPLIMVKGNAENGFRQSYSLGIQSDENLNGMVSKRVVDTVKVIKRDHTFSSVYTTREIDLSTVILLAKVWSHSLHDVGKSIENDCPSMFDGGSYVFSSRQCRDLKGYVANPEDSSRTGKLVSIGYALSNYVQSASTETKSSLAEVRILAKSYLQQYDQ